MPLEVKSTAVGNRIAITAKFIEEALSLAMVG